MRCGILLKNPTASGPAGTMVDIIVSNNEFIDIHEGVNIDGTLRGEWC